MTQWTHQRALNSALISSFWQKQHDFVVILPASCLDFGILVGSLAPRSLRWNLPFASPEKLKSTRNSRKSRKTEFICEISDLVEEGPQLADGPVDLPSDDRVVVVPVHAARPRHRLHRLKLPTRLSVVKGRALHLAEAGALSGDWSLKQGACAQEVLVLLRWTAEVLACACVVRRDWPVRLGRILRVRVVQALFVRDALGIQEVEVTLVSLSLHTLHRLHVGANDPRWGHPGLLLRWPGRLYSGHLCYPRLLRRKRGRRLDNHLLCLLSASDRHLRAAAPWEVRAIHKFTALLLLTARLSPRVWVVSVMGGPKAELSPAPCRALITAVPQLGTVHISLVITWRLPLLSAAPPSLLWRQGRSFSLGWEGGRGLDGPALVLT